jgi:site-specific recombinase XerC
VQGKDPGTLFLNSEGKRLFEVQLLDIVKTQTLRHGGKAVHPHLFRDIYAYMWVDKHPGEIFALSKVLWHSNLDTTVKLYARKFNESSALCRMETLIDE